MPDNTTELVQPCCLNRFAMLWRFRSLALGFDAIVVPVEEKTPPTAWSQKKCGRGRDVSAVEAILGGILVRYGQVVRDRTLMRRPLLRTRSH